MSKNEKKVEVGQRYKDTDARGNVERIGTVDEIRGEKAGITWLHNGRRTFVALHRLRSSDYSLLPEEPGSPLWSPDAT